MTTCDFDNSFFIFKDFIYTNVTYLSCYLQQTNLEPIFLQGDMKVCYCESPLPSQVLNKAKSLAPIETKLAAQMAEKLGSFLWSVDIPLKGLMECLLTTVWSPINNSLSKYITYTALHGNGEELCTLFKSYLSSALRVYLEVNNKYRSWIIIYRLQRRCQC